MAIPMGGATQSQGHPRTYYQYGLSVSDRNSTSVYVRLTLSLRMQWWSNYFSFAIAHECKVQGYYQARTLKYDRHWWGHQWTGSYGDWDFGWDPDWYDYNGDVWHGPYTVFEGWVPIGVDESHLSIIPCITRPPITDSNPLDIGNWAGSSGYWHPWAADEHYGPYAWSGDHEDMAFGNNRWCEELAGCDIGVYPRPDAPKSIILTPPRIDVAVQDTRSVSGDWNDCQRAAKYNLWISRTSSGTSPVSIGTVKKSSCSFFPRKRFGVDEMFDGDKVYLGVQSVDRSGVTSRNTVWAGPTTYYEIPSKAPSSAYLVGRKKDHNQILFRGEDAKLYYSGMSDGSYPIAKYSLYRLEDGAHVDWIPSDASSGEELGQKVVELTMAGVKRPRQTKVLELRAYNTKGRPVYLSGTKSWLRISVLYFGGVVYVYTGERWHEGICYVYTGGDWHESDGVYVQTNGGWHTL